MYAAKPRAYALPAGAGGDDRLLTGDPGGWNSRCRIEEIVELLDFRHLDKVGEFVVHL